MKAMMKKFTALALLALLAACGGGSGGGSTSAPAPATPSSAPAVAASAPATPASTPATTSAKDPISISVTAVKSEIVLGASQQFSATARYADGTTSLLSSSSGVTWTSDTPTILSVFNKGLVTGAALGKGTVIATLGVVSGSMDVTVMGPYTGVAAGGVHTVAIKSDGTLAAWGSNGWGQLGTNVSADTNLPASVAGGVVNWKSVAAGEFHSAALSGSGASCAAGCALWTWGLNQNGQLGDGSQESARAPTKKIGKSATTDWLAVSAGGAHTVAIKKDFTMYSWGSNSYGQLGEGSLPFITSPAAVSSTIGSGAKSWIAVSAGAQHTIAMQNTGIVYRWGNNDRGQLGGSTAPATFFAAPASLDAIKYASIAAGGDHNLAIKPDGSLWAWGANGFGQLGTGIPGDGFAARQVFISDSSKSNNDWLMVAAGGGHNDPAVGDMPENGGHSVGLRKDGTIWSWGSNGYGQLGTGLGNDEPTPVQILVPDGTGRNDDWTMVSAGKFHTFARKQDGTLWGWGRNLEGQLGLGYVARIENLPTRIR